MKRCPYCGKQPRSGKKFCAQCGKQLPIAYLTIQGVSFEVDVVGLNKGTYGIGQSPQNYIPLIYDPSISEYHARIEYINGYYTIIDLLSKGGTYVDSEEIHDRHILHSGQSIKIGIYVLIFEIMGGPQVFISHSSKNNDFTIRIVHDLRAAGAEVWVDMDNIQHGDVWARMNDGLSWCEWLVLILTPEAIDSDFVQMEVNTALHMSMKREIKGVIPLMAVPCNPKAIPPLWKRLKYYDATSDYKSALAGLLRALGIE